MKHNLKNPIRNIKMKNGDRLLHGDVVIFKESLPANFESLAKIDNGVLMHGESGHAHVLVGDTDFDLREDVKTKVKYLKLVEPMTLRHEEHREIEIPPGEYRIGVQQEWSPWERLSRQVVD